MQGASFGILCATHDRKWRDDPPRGTVAAAAAAGNRRSYRRQAAPPCGASSNRTIYQDSIYSGCFRAGRLLGYSTNEIRRPVVFHREAQLVDGNVRAPTGKSWERSGRFYVAQTEANIGRLRRSCDGFRRILLCFSHQFLLKTRGGDKGTSRRGKSVDTISQKRFTPSA